MTAKALFAQLATPDCDYEWYALHLTGCQRWEPPEVCRTLQQTLGDGQAGCLLVEDRTSAGPAWFMFWGPVGTPWRDRGFGRIIGIYVLVEFETPGEAFEAHRRLLHHWWPTRNEVLPEDPSLLGLPEASQRQRTAEWILEAYRIATAPVGEVQAGPCAARPKPESLYRGLSPEGIHSLLADIRAGQSGGVPAWHSLANRGRTIVSAVTENVAPRRLRGVWRALGHSAIQSFPDHWTEHTTAAQPTPPPQSDGAPANPLLRETLGEILQNCLPTFIWISKSTVKQLGPGVRGILRRLSPRQKR